MRAWDGTFLRRLTLHYRFHFCGRCQAETRHACRKDAIGLRYARCLSCREWNKWVG